MASGRISARVDGFMRMSTRVDGFRKAKCAKQAERS